MSTGIIGLRGAGQFGIDFRPTNYRETYTMLEPNGNAPLNALLAMTAAEATDDPKYNNFREELPDRVLEAGGSFTADTAATAIAVTAESELGFCLAGSIIVNASTGEVMHCTEDGGTTPDTLKVTRQIGGTALELNTGDNLFVAGFAAADGSGAPSSISYDPTVDYNYTQIFKQPYEITGTLKNTYRRTGDAEDEYAEKALKIHMSDIERAMFFGKRAEVNGAGAKTTRFTGGLTDLITNQIDVSDAGQSPDGQAGVITEESFDDMLINDVFAFGSTSKIAFCGPKVIAHLQQFGKERWEPTSVDGTYGVSITGYKTFAGELQVHLHPQFRQLPHMQDAMMIVDFPYIKYRHLQNRDTHIDRDIQGNDEDTIKHQYMTDCGLEMLQDKVHTYIKGWSKRVKAQSS